MTSDAHGGLKVVIETVLQGASWQRCRAHFMRHALTLVPKAAQQMVGATIRTVFPQPDADNAREQWRRAADGFRCRLAKLAELMNEAEEDVLAYATFPTEYWQKVWSSNPLEGLNKEVKREDGGGGNLPERSGRRAAGGRGALRCEQHDEWQGGKRYFSAGSLTKLERKEAMAEQQEELVAG